MKPHPTIPFKPYRPDATPEEASRRFLDVISLRRSVRLFSDRNVTKETIHNCIMAAATAPSGANKQPWRFVAVSDPDVKRRIRHGAEEEEREFYARRATPDWLSDLVPLGTDDQKPFLETAPWLVIVFKLMKTDPDEHGVQGKVYYVNESVGIAVGLFLAAVHLAGLCALTHTPSPMGFLGRILGRPEHERPYLLLPVGYPSDDCVVPDIKRKHDRDVIVWR